MALPKSLVNKADEHVSQALQTGARGQTQTTTNYGVIGDAFFKKAQLDLQIANLQADAGYKAASLKSGLEMQIAELDLNAKKLQIDTGFKAAEMKAMAKDREVSFMEQLTGAIGAGASGYMAGQNFGGAENGNKYGTMMGIGAAGLTALSYQSGGRRAGQQSQTVIGNIANMSQSYKQMNDQRIKEDAWSTVVKSGADMIAQYNAAKSPEEQLAAMQKFDSHMGEIYSTAMTMPGANPEQVGTMLAQYRKGLEASIGMTGDAAKKQKEMAQLRNLVDFRADPRSSDPKSQREWAMDFVRKESALFEETTGKQMSVGAMVGRAYQLSDEAGKIIESEVKGIGSMPKAATPSMVPQASQRGMMDMAQKSAANVPQQREEAPRPARPSAPAETERMVGQGGGIPFRPAEGAGIEMDDGMDMFTKPVYAEQKLAEQGAKAVEVLEKPTMEEPGFEERVSSKLKGLGLGFLTSDERVGELQGERQADYDKKLREYRKANPADSDHINKIVADPSLGEEAVPFFTERDPRKIQEAYSVKDKDMDANERAKVAGAASAATQLNKLRDNLNELSTSEIDRGIMVDYQVWKSGEVGDEGIKGYSTGASVAGTGGQWSSFEKSVRQSLEGKGIKGRAAEEQIQLLRKIDTQIDPIAQSMAVAKQGSRPSDADVKAYKGQLANLLDPNPDNSTVGLTELQIIAYRDFQSALNMMPSRAEYLDMKEEEASRKRMKPSEKIQPKQRQMKTANDFIYLGR